MKWSKIHACISLQCIECCGAQYITMVTFQNDSKGYGWSDSALRLEEVGQFEQLTLIVQIQIVRIILNDNKKILYNYLAIPWNPDIQQAFTWKMEGDILQQMKSVRSGKRFMSQVYNKMWCIVIYPNGFNADDEGEVYVELQLCALPTDTNELVINWKISSHQIEQEQNDKEAIQKHREFVRNIFNAETDRRGCDNLLSTTDLKQLEMFSITINVNYIQEDERMTDLEWHQYAQQNQKVLQMLRFEQQT